MIFLDGKASGSQVLREEDAHIFVQDRSELSLTHVEINGGTDTISCAPVDSAVGGCFDKGLSGIYSVLSQVNLTDVKLINTSWDSLFGRLSHITGNAVFIEGLHPSVHASAGIAILSSEFQISNLTIKNKIKSTFIGNPDESTTSFIVNSGTIVPHDGISYISTATRTWEESTIQFNKVTVLVNDVLMVFRPEDSYTDTTFVYTPQKSLYENNQRWIGPFDSSNPVFEFKPAFPHAMSNVRFILSNKVAVDKIVPNDIIEQLGSTPGVTVSYIDKFYEDL